MRDLCFTVCLCIAVTFTVVAGMQQCASPVCAVQEPCQFGRLIDGFGCPTCQCLPQRCPSRRCRQCPSGFQLDQNGCQTCRCRGQAVQTSQTFSTNTGKTSSFETNSHSMNLANPPVQRSTSAASNLASGSANTMNFDTSSATGSTSMNSVGQTSSDHLLAAAVPGQSNTNTASSVSISASGPASAPASKSIKSTTTNVNSPLSSSTASTAQASTLTSQTANSRSGASGSATLTSQTANSGTSGSGCIQQNCRGQCLYGYALDASGCPTCNCETPMLYDPGEAIERMRDTMRLRNKIEALRRLGVAIPPAMDAALSTNNPTPGAGTASPSMSQSMFFDPSEALERMTDVLNMRRKMEALRRLQGLSSGRSRGASRTMSLAHPTRSAGVTGTEPAVSGVASSSVTGPAVTGVATSSRTGPAKTGVATSSGTGPSVNGVTTSGNPAVSRTGAVTDAMNPSAAGSLSVSQQLPGMQGFQGASMFMDPGEALERATDLYEHQQRMEAARRLEQMFGRQFQGGFRDRGSLRTRRI